MAAAVLHGPGDLQVEPLPVPTPGPGEVLVEVSHCGVCGTDLHMVIDGWGRPGSVGGHEWSGTVIATGPGVTTPAEGTAVVGGPPPGCGTCALCRAGRHGLCLDRSTPGDGHSDRGHPEGAFAHFTVISDRAAVPVPDGLDMRTAAVAEPLAVALHAVARSGVRAGQRALITGAGPIGLLTLAALHERGVTGVVVSEPNPVRQDLAHQLGAVVSDPSSFDVPSIAEPSRIVDEAVDVAIECSGKAAAMEIACTQLRRAGTLVLVGAGIEPPRFDPNRILLNELAITGAYEYENDGVAGALALLASGAIDVGPIVEPHDVSLDELGPAMADLAAGRIGGKVLAAPARSPYPLATQP